MDKHHEKPDIEIETDCEKCKYLLRAYLKLSRDYRGELQNSIRHNRLATRRYLTLLIVMLFAVAMNLFSAVYDYLPLTSLYPL